MTRADLSKCRSDPKPISRSESCIVNCYAQHALLTEDNRSWCRRGKAYHERRHRRLHVSEPHFKRALRFGVFRVKVKFTDALRAEQRHDFIAAHPHLQVTDVTTAHDETGSLLRV